MLDFNRICYLILACYIFEVHSLYKSNETDEINVKDCLSQPGKFICDNKQRCLDFSLVCDSHCNCADCSDEKIGCKKLDNMICSKCSETCFKNTSETQTFIPSHWNDTIPCPVCKYKNSFCAQKCYRVDEVTEERCICDENYHPVETPDNESRENICVSDVPYENVLIYSTDNEIKLFNLTTNKTKVLQSGVNCTAVAAAHNDVYYAVYVNASATSIFKTSIDSGKTSELVKSDSLILSVSVDWMTGNIYYTNKSSISVCSNDGQMCSELRPCTKCRVKLVPKLGLMFWSQICRILTSPMDGSYDEYNSARFITITNKFLFTLDESKESLFFTETIYEGFLKMGWSKMFTELLEWRRLGSIETANYTNNLKQIRDITELEDEIYLTVEGSNEVLAYNTNSTITLERLEKKTLARIIDTNATAVKNLFAYNPLLQRTKIPNPCAKSPCSSLCLLKPLIWQKTLTYTCQGTNGTK